MTGEPKGLLGKLKRLVEAALNSESMPHTDSAPETALRHRAKEFYAATEDQKDAMAAQIAPASRVEEIRRGSLFTRADFDKYYETKGKSGKANIKAFTDSPMDNNTAARKAAQIIGDFPAIEHTARKMNVPLEDLHAAIARNVLSPADMVSQEAYSRLTEDKKRQR